MATKLQKSDPSVQEMQTPEWLFGMLERDFGPFELDAASDGLNSKCDVCYTPKDNGLIRLWPDKTFCNPPFQNFGRWVDKALHELPKRSVLIGPAGCSQSWFTRIIKEPMAGALCPTRRVQFNDPEGNPTNKAKRDVMIYIFGYAFADGVKSYEVRNTCFTCANNPGTWEDPPLVCRVCLGGMNWVEKDWSEKR